MKKQICTLLAAALLTGCATGAQPKTTNDSPADFYLQKGYELTLLADKLAESDEYITAFTSADEIRTTVQQIADADYSKPDRAVIISLPNAFIEELMNWLKESDLIALPEEPEIRTQLKRRFTGALPNIVIAQSGTSWLATNSILSVTETYVSPTENLYPISYVLLAYDEPQVYTLISYYMGENGIVTANTNIIKYGTAVDAIFDNADIKAFCETVLSQFNDSQSLDLSQVQITSISKDELAQKLGQSDEK